MEGQSIDEWWEENSHDIFLYKERLKAGFNPNKPMTLKEQVYWRQTSQQRKKCLSSQNPEYAILKAPDYDKQYHLKKWWNTFDNDEKESYLFHVWMNKGDGNMYGFDWWLSYFEEVGFMTNADEERPSHPVTLYRGSEPLFARAMSWTTSLDMAKTFAYESIQLMGEKKVYKTVAEPESILAIFQCNIADYRSGKIMTNGLEYVLDHQKIGDIEEIC